MSPSNPDPVIRDAVRDGIARAVAVVALCGIALIHMLDLPGKLTETPYMFWMYIGLIATALALAGTFVWTSDKRAWAGAAALAATVMLGYALSRTTGLPQSSGDIGNWTEPLGLASLFVEGSLVLLSAAVLSTGAVRRRVPSRTTEPAHSRRLEVAGFTK